jgi:uncharacterized membrane protein YkoI
MAVATSQPGPAAAAFARGAPVQQWAQAGGGSRLREAGDHDIAMDRRGEVAGLSTAIRNAERAGSGRYVGMEPRGTDYRIKLVQPGGRVVWVDVDGRTGTVLRVRD